MANSSYSDSQSPRANRDSTDDALKHAKDSGTMGMRAPRKGGEETNSNHAFGHLGKYKGPK